MNSPQLPAYIRTYVPLIVAWLASLLAKYGFNVSDTLLQGVVGIVLGALYYAAVRYLEKHKAQFGWLLGMAKQPAYSADPAPAPADGQAVVADVVPADPPADNTDPSKGPTD